MDHKTKLLALIPNGDGYNSEYAATLAEAAEYIEQLEDRLFAAGAMEDAPCFCCGYNGSGVTEIVMAERERSKQEMVALTPLALPMVEPAADLIDPRPYWRRYEKRRRT